MLVRETAVEAFLGGGRSRETGVAKLVKMEERGVEGLPARKTAFDMG